MVRADSPEATAIQRGFFIQVASYVGLNPCERVRRSFHSPPVGQLQAATHAAAFRVRCLMRFARNTDQLVEVVHRARETRREAAHGYWPRAREPSGGEIA